MKYTRDALTDVAALTGALPGAVVRLATPCGSVVVVGDHPHGSLCRDSFRQVMAMWDDAHEPAVDSVDFAGAAYESGVLSRPRERLFTTRLSSDRIAVCLRARDDWPERAHATVRDDPLLNRSVVRIFSDDLAESELDDAARLAQGACLVEELVADLQHG